MMFIFSPELGGGGAGGVEREIRGLETGHKTKRPRRGNRGDWGKAGSRTRSTM